MQKIQILINGEHACYIAAKSKREALARVEGSKQQQVGAIWEAVKRFPAQLPVSALDCGKI